MTTTKIYRAQLLLRNIRVIRPAPPNTTTASSAADVDEWFRDTINANAANSNPCVRSYGLGPEGERCKNCVLCVSHKPGKKRFFKCRLRKITHGPATDHRANWPACARFVKAGVS